MRCICCLSDRITVNPFGLVDYDRCRFCNLIFTSDKQNDYVRKTLIDYYQNVDPHKRVADSKRSFFHLALEYLSSYFGDEEKSILDVGCGFGYFLELADSKGWKTFGVEITETAVLTAREKLGGQSVLQGDLKQINFQNCTFDAITLWDVLFLVENPLEILQECFRIIKEGGIIGLRVRNVFFQMVAYKLYSYLKNIFLKLGMKPPYVFHRYSFSSKSIYLLLSQVGFTNIRIINSPLSRADPYGHLGLDNMVEGTKLVIELISRLVFVLSGGMLVIGPSLLIWAQKPQSK